MIQKNKWKYFRILLSVVLLSLLVQAVMGAEVPARADSLVEAGNRHYMAKDYEKAIECYTGVINMGFSAPSLYFNLGNAFYKQNNFPKAILYYEKARLLDPADEDILQNLAMANSRIVDKINSMPDFFLKRWINGLAVQLTPDQWALISLLVFAFSLSAFYLFMFSNGYTIKKVGFTTGVILIALSLTGIFFMHKRKQLIRHSQGAIVIAPVVNVKSSPDEQGTSVFVLHEGTRVVLLDSVLQWKEVKIPDGNKGWIQDRDLAKI